jgi:hypothetical protein
MTKRNNEELIPDLAEEDRKSVDEGIKMLHGVLRNCELYLQDYAAGQQTASSSSSRQNVSVAK